MKSKATKREEALKREAARRARTTAQQLALIVARRGESRREVARLGGAK
jgi:hypothetical protein